ncbi:MAG: hypothetical protein LBV12_00025, partial [Puniceicoccales bacterium]|nr:hypothetical protein [Puniceicoccales bacterium]
MFAKRLSRLFLIILAGTLATTGKHFAEENKSPQRKPLRPFLLALPPSATPDSTNPDLRASALRMLIYQGKTAEAIARLSSEKDPSVFLATLATIGAFGDANDASARAFIIEQCNSENEIIASTAVSILPRLNINDPKIYQAALQHKSNNIRVWAIRSIGDSTIAASFSPEIENSIK